MSAPVPRQATGALAVPGRPRPTPQQARATRRWLLLFLLTPVILILIAYLAVGTSTFKEPTVTPVSVPAGYQAITDAYYGYAIPRSYHQNAAWTDQNGDFFYGAPATGWVAETMLISKHPPGPASPPPASFRSFGEVAPKAFQAQAGREIHVADATVAYETIVTRPGGWRAVAVDSWLKDSSTQMWLLVKAPPSVTRSVVASLRGS